MNISKSIRLSGKTRGEICEEAGISRPYLSLIESGERKIGLAKVARLAAALGIEPKDLRPDLAAFASPSEPPSVEAS